MKYIFKNIGPIKEAKLELGDLTVIAGGNNTGKTYISYVLYGFREYIKNFHHYNMHDILRRYQKKFSDTENEGGIIKGSIPSDILMKLIQDYIKILEKSFSEEGLHSVFSMPKKQFAGASIKIAIEKSDFLKIFSLSDRTGGAKISMSLKDDSVKYEVEFNTNSRLALESSPRIASRHAYELLTRAVLLKILEITPDLILPAERFGISLFYKDLDLAKSRIVELLQKGSDKNEMRQSLVSFALGKSARYALPIRDHIDWTRNLHEISKRTSSLSENKLFENIKQLIDGYYQQGKDEIFFVSRARGKNRYKVPLHIASSSARELSSFYFYLKHDADPNDLIIVDEPESHLDTENQIQMARLLAQCVNVGIRVLITTHSDYIVQELNNMIMLHSAPKNEKIRRLCKNHGYSEHHFLDKNKVKGYLCKDGGLAPCKVDDRGIDFQWFEKTIEKINRVSDILDNQIPRDEK